MAYTDKGKHMVDAAHARTDLHIFAAITKLLEGSLVTSDCRASSAKILRICEDEKERCLRRYDAAIKKAGGGTP